MRDALERDIVAIPEATEAELQEALAYAAKFYLGISPEEFLRRWHAHEIAVKILRRRTFSTSSLSLAPPKARRSLNFRLVEGQPSVVNFLVSELRVAPLLPDWRQRLATARQDMADAEG